MSYSDFTLETAQLLLGISTAPGNVFGDLAPVLPPNWLSDTLNRGTSLSLISEKARSEFIVAPLLLAARELSENAIAIYSGQRLDVNPARGLTGECDFMLTVAPPVLPLRAPIVTLVEAKKNDIENGLGQCVAQMVGARLFNESSGQKDAPIFGCVTTGEVWQFLKLDGALAVLDERRFYLDNPGLILAALLFVIAEGRAALQTGHHAPQK